MGWFGALGYVEAVDRRERGAVAALRAYLRGEASPPRTLGVAVDHFRIKHGRRPRYLRRWI